MKRKQLKAKLDKVFSIYIRKKHANHQGYVKCVTCGKTLHWEGAHAGHFQSRRYLSTRWDEQNVAPQCLTKESMVYLTDGSKKSISDLVKGDSLIAFNEHNFNAADSKVIQNTSFIPKRLFLIETEDGKAFKCTEDHLIVCVIDGQFKWVTVLELSNYLHNDTICDIVAL